MSNGRGALDVYKRQDLDSEYVDADLNTEVELRSFGDADTAGITVEAQLYDAEGNPDVYKRQLPVRSLNMVVLPQFGLPASAIFICIPMFLLDTIVSYG